MLDISLKGKVALVSGGSKGIGRGICSILAQAGADIIINHFDRDEVDAKCTEQIVLSHGVRTLVFKANVADHNETKKMMEKVIEVFGKIDIVVNNAGISTVGNLDELSYDEINRVLDVNVKGPFAICKEVLPYMMKHNYGRIINISSTSMYTGGGGGAHYAASKSALMGMMRNIAKTYGKYHITTNNLAISLIDTELFRIRYPQVSEREEVISKVPVQRAGTPEDIGYAVAFLASDYASYINGEILQIDGGRMYV